MQEIDSQAQLYSRLMMEIKRRLALVEQKCAESYLGIDDTTEFACYQLRRILEMLAFSSLAANKILYQNQFPDFDQHWKAAKILKKLEQINPNFYPRPYRFTSERKIAEVQGGFLTRDDFQVLYDTTSDVIHTWNPYRDHSIPIDLVRSLPDWVSRIHMLLDTHLVHVAGTEFSFLIQLYPPGGKTRVMLMGSKI